MRAAAANAARRRSAAPPGPCPQGTFGTGSAPGRLRAGLRWGPEDAPARASSSAQDAHASRRSADSISRALAFEAFALAREASSSSLRAASRIASSSQSIVPSAQSASAGSSSFPPFSLSIRSALRSSSSTRSVSARSRSERHSASRAACASRPKRSAAPNGSFLSRALRTSSARNSRSSSRANALVVNDCSFRSALWYAASHVARSNSFSGEKASSAESPFKTRRASGASALTAARRSRAIPATSSGVIAFSGTQYFRNLRASSGAATSSRLGREAGATGPPGAKTTRRSSSKTSENLTHRRSLSAVARADMSASRFATSVRASRGALATSSFVTSRPSSDRRFGMRARTCARYQGARLSGVSSSESASRRGHARATRSSCRTSSTGLSPALSRRSAGNRVRLEKSRIRFRETYRRSTFRHTARGTSASISETRRSTTETRRLDASYAPGWSRRTSESLTGRSRSSLARMRSAAREVTEGTRGAGAGGRAERARSGWRARIVSDAPFDDASPCPLIPTRDARGCERDRGLTSARGGAGAPERERASSHARCKRSGDGALRPEGSAPRGSEPSPSARPTRPLHAGSNRACRRTSQARDCARRPRSWSAAYPPAALASATSSAIAPAGAATNAAPETAPVDVREPTREEETGKHQRQRLPVRVSSSPVDDGR